MITFIIHYKNGTRQSYSVRGNEDNEQDVDAAYDEIYIKFPDADYIEKF